MAHTLVVSRSGGGKSHLLATLSYALAGVCAVRHTNLKALSGDSATGLAGRLPQRPPLSLCVVDPHRDLAARLLEDLSMLVAAARVSRWQGAAREKGCRLPAHPDPAGEGARLVAGARPAEGWWEDNLEELLVYLDLGDKQAAFGLNLLDVALWNSQDNCAGTVIEIMRRIWPEAWGPRMEDCLRHSLLALFLLNTCRYRKSQFTLLDVIDFITLDSWREALLEHPVIREENPEVWAWWKIQFEGKTNEYFQQEVIKPVLNKLNPLASSEVVRRILGQSRTTLDFGPLLARGGIILLNLDARVIEDENCALAGAVLIGFLLKKAREGGAGILLESDRPQVLLVVDEFHKLAAAPFDRVFAEDRKFGVRAALATQSLKALDKLNAMLRPLTMANAANLLVLQVNAEDEEYLRRELVADGSAAMRESVPGSLTNPAAGAGNVGPDHYDLVNAARGLCYAKLTVKGQRRPVFTVRVAERPFGEPPDRLTRQEAGRVLERVRARSGRCFTRPGYEVEEELREKKRAYLELHRFRYDLEGSNLVSGFYEGSAEVAAMLRQKLEQLALESLSERLEKEYRIQRNMQRHRARGEPGREAPETGPEGRVGEPEENATGKGQGGRHRRKKDKTRATTALEESREPAPPGEGDEAVKAPESILPFAVDLQRPAPVRRPGTPLLDHREGLNRQDFRDYRPGAQVELARRARQSEEKQKQEGLKKPEAGPPGSGEGGNGNEA
jgi:hypothetical protein